MQFSIDQYIGSKKPSENSPFFKVTNTSFINLEEEVNNFLFKSSKPVIEEFQIEKASPYFIKGNRYYLFIDNHGRVITVRADLVIKNIFSLETSKITSIRRHNLSVIFSTENTVGFLKVFEELSDQVF